MSKVSGAINLVRELSYVYPWANLNVHGDGGGDQGMTSAFLVVRSGTQSKRLFGIAVSGRECLVSGEPARRTSSGKSVRDIMLPAPAPRKILGQAVH
jgi:hypothetical protein